MTPIFQMPDPKIKPVGWKTGVTAHGWRRRNNLALPVMGSCTLRSVVVTVGVFVTVVQETASSEVVASRT